MPTTGAYTFKRAKAADNTGLIQDENAIALGEWAWIDRTVEWEGTPDYEAGSRRVLMIYARCPDCGLLATVWRMSAPAGKKHDVSVTGALHPSAECPHTIHGQKCGFHTQPTQLDGFVDLRILKKA